MLVYIWPMLLVVLSNVLYNIASKSVPGNSNPFFVLVVTYITAALLSFLCYFLFDSTKNLHLALRGINWAGFGLGLSMVGLEIGYIFIYRTGWKISIASLVANILLAIALILVGTLFYKESLNAQQCIGIVVCLIGVIVLLTARV